MIKKDPVSHIVFSIPFGYQFFEEASRELVYLRVVPFEELVEVVVTGYIYCLCFNKWPSDYFTFYDEDFVFDKYMPSLSDMNNDIEALHEEMDRACAEIADLTVELHCHTCKKNRYIKAIFQQPAFYLIKRIGAFGGHKKHMEIVLELQPYEDDEEDEEL